MTYLLYVQVCVHYLLWSILHLIHTCILHPMNAFLKHSLLERSLKWILCSAITFIFHHIHELKSLSFTQQQSCQVDILA